MAIRLAENTAEVFGPARRVIHLRPEPEVGENDLGSIYRYDRDALLAALKQARTGTRA